MAEVFPILANRIYEAGDAMAEAFMDDPFCRFVIPDDTTRLELTREMFTLTCRSRIERGEILLGIEDQGQIAGVICASGPFETQAPDGLRTAWEEFDRRLGRLGAERFDRYVGMEQERRSPEPQIHVNGLAVRPALQGNGFGRAPLEAVIAISESTPESAGVGLDTATIENVRFYERRGFRVLSEGDIGGCRMWFMFRANGQRAR
jgi:ribosomal protein S18 acetylase RimI-like enzyme